MATTENWGRPAISDKRTLLMCLVVIIQLEALWPKALHKVISRNSITITKDFLYNYC